MLNALSLVLRTLCPYCSSWGEDNENVDRLTVDGSWCSSGWLFVCCLDGALFDDCLQMMLVSLAHDTTTTVQFELAVLRGWYRRNERSVQSSHINKHWSSMWGLVD